VDHVSEGCAETHYAHDGKQGFPFAYLVRQQIQLDKTMLRISLGLHNTGNRSMPAGLGIHPYFCKGADTRLQATHRGRWTGSEVAADERFMLPAEVPEAGIDDCFIGWTGIAYLTGLNAGTQITIHSSEVATVLVVYSPAGSDFVCVEPASNVNDGINAFARDVPDTGVRVLEPGMSMELTTVIRVESPGRGSRGQR
jgi:aldose 1-epimerase